MSNYRPHSNEVKQKLETLKKKNCFKASETWMTFSKLFQK